MDNYTQRTIKLQLIVEFPNFNETTTIKLQSCYHKAINIFVVVQTAKLQNLTVGLHINIPNWAQRNQKHDSINKSDKYKKNTASTNNLFYVFSKTIKSISCLYTSKRVTVYPH